MTYIGNESFMIGGRPISITMNDYWRWAYSDLANSLNRSVLAKFIVSSSIGASRINALQQYDLLSSNGYKLSVRSAAYILSDDGDHPDQVSFQIAPSRTIDTSGIQRLDAPLRRSSDAYVFCLYKAMEKDESPLDLDLWEFYILSTSILEEKKPFQKTITLPSLLKLEPVWSDYYGIEEAIKKVMDKGA